MSAPRLSPEVQQRLAVLVPVIALAISVFVVYPGYVRYRELRDDIAAKQERLANLRGTPIPLQAAIKPAAPDTPSEPPEFLASIRQMAAESRCELTGFDLTLPPAPPSGEQELAQGGNKPEEKKEPPSPIRPVRAKIEVRSDYDGIRSLVRAIMLAPRLYAVAGCEVQQTNDPSGPPLRATIEIERYVLKPDAGGTPTGNAAPAAAG
jgi:hypothetical protein